MSVPLIAVALYGLAATALAALMGVKLYRWERQLAGARIAIAYKQKVRMQAPLIEWLTWANMLANDERSSGRVVYRQASTTVAILKPRGRHEKTTTKTVREPTEQGRAKVAA